MSLRDVQIFVLLSKIEPLCSPSLVPGHLISEHRYGGMKQNSLCMSLGVPVWGEAGEAGIMTVVPSSIIRSSPAFLAWTGEGVRVRGDLEPLPRSVACPRGTFRSNGSSKESIAAAQGLHPAGEEDDYYNSSSKNLRVS